MENPPLVRFRSEGQWQEAEMRERKDAVVKLKHVFFQGVVLSRPRPRVSDMSGRRRSQVALAEAEQQFLDGLFERAGLQAKGYRGSALARRLPACLRFLRVNGYAEGLQRLGERPDLVAGALSVVLLGVTEFFRDRLVFEQLRTVVLPELGRRQTRPRIWSAACSDGPELYSVALLLDEAGRLGQCELLGTDCRPEAIAQARAGVFAREAVERLEPRWRDRYFSLRANSGVVAARVRERLDWRVADLFGQAEPGPWDLILWRNMAIYLEAAAAVEAWSRICAELAPGGFLVTGKADYPPKRLPLRRVGPCLFRKEEV